MCTSSPWRPVFHGSLLRLCWLALCSNHHSHVCAAFIVTQRSGPWTNNLFYLQVDSDILLTIDDVAFADITSGPLASIPEEFGTRIIRGGGQSVVAADLGGIGGRDAMSIPIIINPSPVVCSWRGGAVANLSCDKCSFGYVRNDAGSGCTLPAFGVSPAAWTPLERAKLDGNDDL